MSSIVVPQQKRSIWEALAALDFISDWFSWFFMLLTRLSEPFMLLSTLYIIGEAGVPAISLAWLHSLALIVMITAPELILPGSFVVAARADGRQRTILFATCYLFLFLTGMTLISLFVWHLSGASLAWLMCARCAAAVGYSILMRVMNHGQLVESQSKMEARHQAELHALNQSMDQRIEQVTASLTTAMNQQMDRQLEHLRQVFKEQLEQVQTTTMDRLEQTVEARLQELDRERATSLKSSPRGSSNRPLELVQKRGDEQVASRVTRYVLDHLEQGQDAPSIRTIMAECRCSKGTAIKYRDLVLKRGVA